MSHNGFRASVGATQSPWRDACDVVDGQPFATDLVLLAVACAVITVARFTDAVGRRSR